MAVEDVTLERGPFKVTIEGVTGLVPEVKLWNSADPVPGGQYKVTATQVVEWLDELTGVLAMTLDGWQGLSTTPVMPEDDSDRDQFIAYARTVIHNGAASYLDAARRPEQAARAATSYADVLWNRYTDGLDRLSAWLTKRLADPEPGDTPNPDAGELSFSFPCPTFPDHFAV